eukprot:1179270-Alexandrium_andersonii.AAC.1
MSASLVGSEMCIRDRPTRPPHGHHPGIATLAQPGAPAPATDLAWAPEDPVSYTHLTLPTICSV